MVIFELFFETCVAIKTRVFKVGIDVTTLVGRALLKCRALAFGVCDTKGFRRDDKKCKCEVLR